MAWYFNRQFLFLIIGWSFKFLPTEILIRGQDRVDEMTIRNCIRSR